ncbi:hypothetical protein XcvCFBP7113P_11205 [Xanthomonas citri pv. vignicola]|nr:hypothetical protein XcvCFBP7113P_11205 [Xanthomonas citri pv. vignicola]
MQSRQRRLLLGSLRWSKQVDLTLGIPVPIADGMLTLVDATPAPIAPETAARSAARFTFTFQGGR